MKEIILHSNRIKLFTFKTKITFSQTTITWRHNENDDNKVDDNAYHDSEKKMMTTMMMIMLIIIAR
jgi:hypothetical protein